MSQKRIFIEQGIYFITTNTYQRKKIFISVAAAKLFLEVLTSCRLKYRFKIYAYVVIFDHVHLIIQPDQRNTISDVMRFIKGSFARSYCLAVAEGKSLGYRATVKRLDFLDGGMIPKNGLVEAEGKSLGYWPDNKSPDSVGGGFTPALAEAPVWQSSFYDRLIRNEKQLLDDLRYIDFNFQKHGLIADTIDWPFSSYHNHFKTNKHLIEIDNYENI